MRRRILTSTLLLSTFCLMLAAGAAHAGDPGSAGFLSLRLGVGARAGGMGDTGVAEAVGPTAVYWNPANLVYGTGTQVTLQHMEYLANFRKESFAISHQLPWDGALGFLFSGFYSETLDRFLAEPVGIEQGTFRPYDLVVAVAYGQDIKDLSFGATVKFLYERIDVEDGNGWAIDLGVTHKAQIDGLTLAAAIQNFQPNGSFKLKDEEFDLPVTLRLGAGFTPPSLLEGRITVASEILVPNDGNSRLHAGGEVRLHPSFSVRGGNRFSYDTYGVTFGAGFHRGQLSVDYAFMDNSNGFDPAHRFSLTIKP